MDTHTDNPRHSQTARPLKWVPTLYFAEALPYMAVMTLSVVMYTNMGLSNTELALYPSWLYLPWVIKPLWSPLIDTIRNERWWILATQTLIGASLAGVALTLHTAVWLKLSLAFFWIMAFASATHDIAADGLYILRLDEREQALYVGWRSTFYRIGSIFCQGGLVILAGVLEGRCGIPIAWSLTVGLLAAIMVMLVMWHGHALPHVHKASPPQLNLLSTFAATLRAMSRKPRLVPSLLFMLLFRLPEAQLAKMATPFLLRSKEQGGLALDTASVGFAYGTLGVVGLLGGGIIAGWLVSRHGLKKWWWPMIAAISLPDAVYIYLSLVQPDNILLIDTCVFVEQFGYGFGFTAYMLYLVYFAKGEMSTSVFSFCTALQALGMMIPGMVAGQIADQYGFTNFFIWVMICTLVTFSVSAMVKVKDIKQ